MITPTNTIDLTAAAAGTMIMTPWGNVADREPVQFDGISKDWNEDDEEVYAVNYTDARGDKFCILCDDQFATLAGA